MRQAIRRWWLPVLVLAGLSVWATLPAVGQVGQVGAKNGEWTTYGGDLANTRYAPLDQINANNFNTLQVAWRFKTESFGPRAEQNLEGTPLMVRGVLYATVGTRRAIVAVDAATGELIWSHSEREGPRGDTAPRQLSGRGLSYWSDGREERILYVTPGYRLIALDTKTGDPIQSFGNDGVVDLKLEDDQNMDLVNGEVGLHSAPVVAGNTIIIGAAHLSGSVPPKGKTNEKGFIRGYDVKTGKRLWIFHTIPQRGEFGNDTWLDNSWTYSGNTGSWGQMSVDEELGMVYVPVEMGTGDYYGGHRPGNNLVGESVVALDLKTGQRKWHYQLVHHGIWDFDIPCAPILADITVNGQRIKALAQPTKQAMLYMFDRATGKPIFPIEERPVEKGDVPGEWYAPTQPMPLNGRGQPFAYDWNGFQKDYIIDFTPALRAEGEPRAGGRGGGGGEGGPAITVEGLPIVKPPYGSISAISLDRGEVLWQIAHGDTPDNVRNHAALRGVTIPRTGQAGIIGTLVTKTLLVAGEAVETTNGHARGALLRAYDKATGKDAGAVLMPARQSGSPMTYMLNGRQYIVVSIGGGGTPGELVAFRLPANPTTN